MILKGKKVTLRPMKLSEAETFFKWATESDGAKFWYGELYGEKAPTYEEFRRDWKNYYFDGTKPRLGRCFVILAGTKPIGQINYNEIDKNNSSELDIIIASADDKNKGYGSDAIRALSKYLFEKFNLETVWIEAIEDNPRAIRAYQKAGFKRTNIYKKKKKVWIRLELRRSML